MYSRREFTRLALGATALPVVHGFARAPAQLSADATVRGVKIGAITGVFGPFEPASGQDVVDVVIERARTAGIGHIEFVNSLIEPRAVGGGVGGRAPDVVTPEYTESREALRRWRLAAPLEQFASIRRRFDAAGINLYSYVVTIGDDFTDEEIGAVFGHMQALGVDKFCTNQTRVVMGPRIAPFAERTGVRPAFHPHAEVDDPDEVGSPESLARLLAMSDAFMINLDIGHFARGGNEPLAYLLAHADRITHLHVRDRGADGEVADIGTGVLRVDEMLRFVRDNGHDVGFILEQRRSGFDSSTDGARANLAYLRQVLES